MRIVPRTNWSRTKDGKSSQRNRGRKARIRQTNIEWGKGTETVYVSLYDENGHYRITGLSKGQPLKPGEEAHLVRKGVESITPRYRSMVEGNPEEVAMAAMEARAKAGTNGSTACPNDDRNDAT